MEANTRSRADLKSYFVKNAIPTESNFAELIDGMINQKDDGLVILPKTPLSIEAADDPTGNKPTIHFYGDFSSPNPDWILNLNPYSDPSDDSTAKPGFNISDKNGNSRLFIEQTTGNIGIKTINPRTELDVSGSIMSGKLTIGPWPAGPLNFVFFGSNALDQKLEGNYALLQRFSGRTFLNSPEDIRIRINNRDKITIANSGNVGILETDPQERLQIGESSGGGAAFHDGGNKALVWNAYHDTGWKYMSDRSAAMIYINYSAETMSLCTAGKGKEGKPFQFNAGITINAKGHVGIGTSPTNVRLHVAGGETILQQEEWKTVKAVTRVWRNYSNDSNRAGYFKDSHGIVHLRGTLLLLDRGRLGAQKIFTLPNGYKPAKIELHIVAAFAKAVPIKQTTTHCQINKDGEVSVGAEVDGFSLDGITFRAA